MSVQPLQLDEQLRAFLKGTVDAYLVVSSEGTIVLANDAVARLLDFSPGELQDRAIGSLVPERFRDVHTLFSDPSTGLREVGPLPVRLVVCVLSRNGREFPAEVSLSLIQRGSGLIAVQVRDLSEIESERQSLLQSARTFRATADYTCDWESWHGTDGQLIWVNPAVERLTGYSEPECHLMGDYPLPIVDEPHRPIMAKVIEDACRGTSGHETELRIRRRDGKLRWMSVSWQPIYDDDGLELGFRTSIRDITNRKVAEDKFRQIFETAPDAKFLVDAEGKILLVNAQAEALFGYKRSELFGNSVEMLIPARFRDAHPAKRAEYFRNPHVRPMRRGANFRGLRKDGSEFPAEISLSPLHTDEGLVVAAAIRDVTERTKADEQMLQHLAELAHVSRLSTMGEMAAGLAHELNQPLYAITNYARACQQLVAATQSPAAELAELSEKLLGQANRAADIIRRLRRFVSRREPHRAPIDLNHLVREVEQLVLFQAHRYGIETQLLLGNDLPQIRGDSILLEQVLVNLMRNAFEAMNEAGSLKPTVTVQTAVGPNQTVEVTVTDAGPGFHIAPDQLFEAFYTTKEQGMGMGLAISRTIAEAHGGRLTAAMNPRGGATFRLSLPINREDEDTDGQ